MATRDSETNNVRKEQALILRRIVLAGVSYLATAVLTAIFWWLGYFDIRILLNYAAVVLVFNCALYLAVLTDFNLRFADRGMTSAQILFATAAGLYVMYYAQHARGVFLLLSVSAMMYGLFQLRTRTFLTLTFLVLCGYATLIALLAIFRPHELILQIEILQWIALGACLLQFSTLGGYITKLRAKVKHNNQQLEGRNRQLEAAFARIEELAMRDELTGVFNRRHLMEATRLEKQRIERNGNVFSICILDVDFFKKVNDAHGHLGGDQVLMAVAATAAKALRETDHFGRYGGEEFACLLTDTPLEGALVTAERIRANIAALRFPAMNPDLEITVSVGIADCMPNETVTHAFKRADDALYDAKKNGRNRCAAALRNAEADVN
jgi:diguanylate cyclase